MNRLLAAGKHPGIVELQDVWADGDAVPWLRYEYVPGGDLTQLIRLWAALPMAERVPKVLAAFRELCDTVGHFHWLTPSIVHRDLKPSNILITADAKLKVGDFGIGSVSAKRVLDGERLGTLSRTNTLRAYLRGAHTPLYAPPEQKSDPKHRPIPTDDVHALGVILFQMLTGKLDAAPGARFDRDLQGVPQLVVDLIGDCVDGEKARRPEDGVAVLGKLLRATESSAFDFTPIHDHAKEESDRRAREQAERNRQAEEEQIRIAQQTQARRALEQAERLAESREMARRREAAEQEQRIREAKEHASEQRVRQIERQLRRAKYPYKFLRYLVAAVALLLGLAYFVALGYGISRLK